MAESIAHTLSVADLGEHASPRRAIAVIQAGTGVGKSAAYASTAIALALKRKTRVLISTATVVLQEQLMQKDLPALAASLPHPFVFALAKGRSRYVCKLKLERMAGSGAMEDDLFGDLLPQTPASTDAQIASEEKRTRQYEQMLNMLAKSQWDGDRDSLAETPDPRDWSSIAAERHTCTVRQCPLFKECSYYNARAKLAEANVIVANHDLVLASIGMKTLPELHNCLVVFDEAHHLPAVALDQFSSSMDMSNLKWIDFIPKIFKEISEKLNFHLGEDAQTVSTQLKAALTQLARMSIDLVWAQTGKDAYGSGKDGTLRFANGVLPEALREPVSQIQSQSTGLRKLLDTLATETKLQGKENPEQAAALAQWYAKLGALAPRLDSLVSTSGLLLEHGEQPLAKWLQVDSQTTYLTATAHACPIVPGDLLRQFLWSQVRGAVLTSASLTSCDSFDYFLNESGLANNPNVTTLAVSSPFDYTAQGTLTLATTHADPKNSEAYTAEMVSALVHDLQQVQHGALVLFTSWAQMRFAIDKLPSSLVQTVLVQGTQSRQRLLDVHVARVESGQASVLFGLQSFGEGLDLPGALCATLCITKLPFSPPSAPVDEARAQWLRSVGRDPFNELVIPATAIKLLQWTGRAIRTETDHAHIICYDKRLFQTTYGKRMLKGLPPYTQQIRPPLAPLT
jgi:ATP-dependent DNA helicase DinG